MTRVLVCSLCLLHLALAPHTHADDKETRTANKDIIIELFNGKDLTGWGYKTGEKFDGKTESDDRRYSWKDGVLTVHPGKGIRQLWTTATFPTDFELRLEFRAAVNADSGLFV